MKTITYIYDETRCTNKDYLILELTESIDDGGAGYESVAEYDISCPYTRNSDCLNNHEGNQYDSKEYRDGCVRCKLAWLESKSTDEMIAEIEKLRGCSCYVSDGIIDDVVDIIEEYCKENTDERMD